KIGNVFSCTGRKTVLLLNKRRQTKNTQERKSRRAQVLKRFPRSSSILNNSSQALRPITGAASAKKQRQKK
ncbi:unnamed protein product, partial [Brassica oleracea]